MEVNKLNLVLMGTNKDVIDKQGTLLSALDIIKNEVVCQSIIDAVSKYMADENTIVILNLSANGLQELKFLEVLPNKKSSMIIIGEQGNVELLTQALRAGVKDFIDEKEYEAKLLGVASNVIKHVTHNFNDKNVGHLNVFITARGGSGASFVASNVAYLISKEKEQKVALVDLDLQFGSIGLNFNMMPKYTLADAVKSIDELDNVSLEAYMLKYNDNLSLLLPSASEILLHGDISISKLESLLVLLKVNFNQIVIDMPRIIDPMFSMVMERADHITLVVQQSLAQYRDALRLVKIINKDLEISLDKIVIVINRYDPKSSFRIADLKSLINHDKIYTIASDYERVENASNLGVPLCDSSGNSKIAKDLKKLAQVLEGDDFKKSKKSIFRFFGFK
ncbi:MAG: AAA family ATPase [Methylococcales bacterium]